MQRCICEVLATDDYEFPIRELRRSLEDPDRSNVRRAVRGLLRRGMVQQIGEGVGSRLKLTYRGMLVADHLFGEVEPDPMVELDRWRKKWDAFERELKRRQEEELRRWREEEERWEKLAPRYERYRFPSKNQLRIIAVLVRYATDPQRGLPASAVRKIASVGDKSNSRRAERSLLKRGIIQRPKDRKRLRIPSAHDSLLWHFAPDVVDPPLDDANAEAVLEGFGEWAEVVA